MGTDLFGLWNAITSVEEDTQSWWALGIILYQIPIIVSIGMALEGGGGTCPWCPLASATYVLNYN